MTAWDIPLVSPSARIRNSTNFILSNSKLLSTLQTLFTAHLLTQQLVFLSHAYLTLCGHNTLMFKLKSSAIIHRVKSWWARQVWVYPAPRLLHLTLSLSLRKVRGIQKTISHCSPLRKTSQIRHRRPAALSMRWASAVPALSSVLKVKWAKRLIPALIPEETPWVVAEVRATRWVVPV